MGANELLRETGRLEKNDLWQGSVQQRAQQEAEQELLQLQVRIPRIVVRVEGVAPVDLTLTIDGAELPNGLIGVDRFGDPGERHIVG